MTEAITPPSYEDYARNTYYVQPTVASNGSVAFISNEPGQFQAFHRDARTGEVAQLTDLPRGIDGIEYSPVDPQLLVVWHDDVGDELYQLSLVHMIGEREPRVEPLTTDSEVKYLLGGWSPNGSSIAYTANRKNETAFTVEIKDVVSGTVRTVTTLEGRHDIAGFTPDGSHLVVSRMATTTTTELMIYNLNDAEPAPQPLTPVGDGAYYGPPSWLDNERFFLLSNRGGNNSQLWEGTFDEQADAWALKLVLDHSPWDIEGVVALPPTGGLVAVTNVEGDSRVSIHGAKDLATSRRELATPKGIVEYVVPTPKDGQFVLTLGTYALGDRIMMGDYSGAGAIQEIASPTQYIPAKAMAEPELFRYATFDGESIPCFVYRPTHDRGGAVVYVHGGPESQFRPGIYSAPLQHMVSQGYTVYAPNVRGSDGYGKRFLNAANTRKRLDAVEDLHFLHRRISDDGEVDPARIALMGSSYGGYMVLAGLAFQPKLWAAGVSTSGISDIETFLNNTSPYRRPLREPVYGSPEKDATYLAAASPLRQAHSIEAPLLLLHGRHDPRVPLSEAEQMRDALTSQGVRVELVVYEDEGHDLARRVNKIDAQNRKIIFLNSVLRPE